MGAFIDLSGKKFTRLLVVERIPRSRKGGGVVWKCLCDCGHVRAVPASNLRSGDTKSCGCYKADNSTKHGHYKTRTYRSWEQMKQRCLRKTHVAYKYYGGAGVAVCDRWLDFRNFIADMGERPPGTSLDRYPNANGNYKPGNCRWATPNEQARNRDSVVKVVLGNSERSFSEWCEIFGVKPSVVRRRIDRNWDVLSAMEITESKVIPASWKHREPLPDHGLTRFKPRVLRGKK